MIFTRLSHQQRVTLRWRSRSVCKVSQTTKKNKESNYSIYLYNISCELIRVALDEQFSSKKDFMP